MSEGPSYIEKTPLERAMFGFAVEVDSNPTRFFNAEFINGIIRQEQLAGKFVGRAFLSLIVLNSVSIGYVEGVTYKFQLYGLQLSPIPGAAVALCLFLGGVIFTFTSRLLDQLVVGRMRWVVLHKLVGTDLVNMATAHLKGDNVWSDLMTPRFVGYSSARAHEKLGQFYLIAFMVFIGSILFASYISLIAIFRFNLFATGFSLWSATLSGAGLLIGSLGIANAVISVGVPFKFILPALENAQSEQQIADALVQSGPPS